MVRSVLAVFTGLCVVCFAQSGASHETLPAELNLQQAEELLLSRSLAVTAAKDQVAIAAALREIAALKPAPTLMLGAEQFAVASPVLGRVNRPFATNSDAGANPATTVQLSRTIERGHKRELRVLQQQVLQGVAEKQVLDAFRQQLLALRQSFTTGLFAKESLRLAQEQDERYAETLRIVEMRFQAGDIAAVDVDRVKADRIQYKQAVLQAEANYRRAAQEVACLLQSCVSNGGRGGVSMAPVVELTGLMPIPDVTARVEELRQQAMEARPDLAAARGQVEASNWGTRLASAQGARDLTTAFEFQQVGADSSVGATVSFPLFVGKQQRAGVSAAVAQQRLAATQARLAEMEVMSDVEKAFASVQAARRALDLYGSDTVERAARIRNVIEYSYQRGEASLIEVLDADRTAIQTMLAFNQAKADYANAYWTLESAVGKSW